MSCHTDLAWYDLVPIMSWVVLRGKCRMCRASISIQYPLVEAITGVVFGVIGYASLPLSLTILALPVAALLVAIGVYDMRHLLIPDLWAYGCAACAFAGACMAVWSGYVAIGVPLLMIEGFVTALPLFIFWLVSRGTWMGLGDAKLALSFGWLLGIQAGLYAVFAAFVIGAIVSVVLLGMSSRGGRWIWARMHIGCVGADTSAWTMQSEIPFGPFLVLSCFLTWFAMLYGIALPFFPW